MVTNVLPPFFTVYVQKDRLYLSQTEEGRCGVVDKCTRGDKFCYLGVTVDVGCASALTESVSLHQTFLSTTYTC